MYRLAFSATFEYLCYGTRVIINILPFSVRGPSLMFTDVRFLRMKTVPALEGLNTVKWVVKFRCKVSEASVLLI